MSIHLIWANVTNTAMHMCLRYGHPLRRLLHSHFWRSATTSLDATDTLLPEGGIVHRANGLTYDGCGGSHTDAEKRQRRSHGGAAVAPPECAHTHGRTHWSGRAAPRERKSCASRISRANQKAC